MNSKTGTERPHVGFDLKKLSNMMKTRIDNLSKETGLTGFQGYLVGYLILEGGKRDVFQRDVEKHMEISRASVTSILQLLEKNGFIRRESVTYDARLKKIVVTEKGLQANQRIMEMLDQVEDILVQGVSPEDLDVFMSVLKHMKTNLEKLENKKEEKK